MFINPCFTSKWRYWICITSDPNTSLHGEPPRSRSSKLRLNVAESEGRHTDWKSHNALHTSQLHALVTKPRHWMSLERISVFFEPSSDLVIFSATRGSSTDQCTYQSGSLDGILWMTRHFVSCSKGFQDS